MSVRPVVAHQFDSAGRPGWANMAIDQAILDEAERTGTRFLRIYRWDPHCLSFGRHEPASTRYSREHIAALGLDVVRRPTGGRAVWHARELTYAFAGPVDAFGSAAEAYRNIHEAIAEAICDLGARAWLAPRNRTPPPGAGACFAFPAGGEVIVEGRKVVGSAQLLKGSAFLQHGSLLLEDDQAILDAVTCAPPPARIDAPLARLLGRSVAFDDAAAAVAHAVERRFGSFQPTDRDSVLGAAESHYERFQASSWTWCR